MSENINVENMELDEALLDSVGETLLDENTLVDFHLSRGEIKRVKLRDLVGEGRFKTLEEAIAYTSAFIQTGNAFIVDARTSVQSKEDQVFAELTAVNTAKEIKQAREEKVYYRDKINSATVVNCEFNAKSILDAQEIMQMLLRNYNIPSDNIEMTMTSGKYFVRVTDCPTRIYEKVCFALGAKRGVEEVAGFVERTADTAVNGTDMVLNDLAVPVAKTAIKTTTKVGKSALGLIFKLGGIAVTEVTRSGKQLVAEIKSDGYINEAKGEVLDGVHSIKRAVGKKQAASGNSVGRIIE